MRVLVVGGSRFVGYLLVWRLLARGDSVTIFNRGTHPDPFGDRIERLKGDRRTEDLSRLLRGRRTDFDAVVDFAGYEAGDIAPAIDLLKHAIGHHVFISTGQVYLVRHPRPAAAAVEEDYEGPVMAEPPPDSPDHPEWSYGVHKRACEDLLMQAHRSDGFPATVVRIPMVNGERDHYCRIESYLWRLLDGAPVLVPAGGSRPMRHVYGRDVARAIAGFLGEAKTLGRAYNLAQDETPTLVEILAQLAGMLGAPARLVKVTEEELARHGLTAVAVSPFSGGWMSNLDPSRAKRELAFEHLPLSTYLQAIVASFLSHPPISPPDSYRHRAIERELAARSTPIAVRS